MLCRFVTNVWQLLAGPNVVALVRRLWPMMAGILTGTVASAGMLTGGAAWTTAALGVVLIVYAGFSLLGCQLSVSPAGERWLAPLVGTATGLVTGATGVFVIPAVPYLQALGLAKDDLVQALGLSFTISTIALALALFVHGAGQTPATALTSVLVVLPALAGMWIGQRIRGRIDPAAFRRWFLVALLLLGCELALRPFW